jgi:hypothetical protein
VGIPRRAAENRSNPPVEIARRTPPFSIVAQSQATATVNTPASDTTTTTYGTAVAVVMSFRSSKGHDYDWLKKQYLKNRGAQFPAEVAKDFVLVNTWATDLRYQAGAARFRDAAAFLGAVETLIVWADGRL